MSSKTPDWSASQYLKFNNERTRPVYDLISQTLPHLSSNPSPKIQDLGCGPGNSTSALLSTFPDASITGLDSSPDMIREARATLPSVTFTIADLSSYTAPPDADLLFSNAVFHWLRSSSRIPTLQTLFRNLKSGAVLAFQVPDNYHEQSHALMRDTASLPGKSWTDSFAGTKIGDLQDATRPDLDPIEKPEAFIEAFTSEATVVNVWRTTYFHVLQDAHAIVEWVRGTGLQPFLHRMEDEKVRGEFLQEYERRIAGAYGALKDGTGRVVLGYPRLFVVAVRK
ncbi:S-adenosyl-L-methionine-dependent methyltransferase [Dendryphion nanum]|uniref:S-adenosyl-L-methionine-dependent methyltransferase n=1 Tax=Dendryphion nanum TaxID=256645 RepID=A0A9P9ILS1_9PLEO|nr:S-adenosyl-L-methionine-dependent methyltransferase [Dendryphion nanum]